MTLRRKGGFTIIELLMVIGVITILAGMALPAFMISRRYAERRAAQGLLESVTLAATVYQQRWWTFMDPVLGGRRTVRMWDWNADGILDGRPTIASPGVEATALEQSGYTSFFAVANPMTSKAKLDAAEHLLDPWRRPLRISFATELYGSRGFAVWSTGPDGLCATPAERADDQVLGSP